MTADRTFDLLRRALALFNDRPNFGLRRDAGTTSYALAAAIEAHLERVDPGPDHPAIAAATALWADDPTIEIDEEAAISESTAGIWVRAWLLVETPIAIAPDTPAHA